MSKLLINLFKEGSNYLIISCLIFPLSLKAALAYFAIFLINRILVGDLSSSYKWQTKKSIYLLKILKISLAIAIAIATIDFYFESRIHFYPVSYYDYLWAIVTALIVKLYPLSLKEIRNVYLALALSPLIVFFSHLNTANFLVRNNWGFDNANGLGMYCAICLPLILGQYLEIINKTKLIGKPEKNQLLCLTYLLIISFILCFVMLISSGSRSSFYTSILIFFFSLFIYLKSWQKLFQRNYFLSLKNKYFCLSLFAYCGLLSVVYRLIVTRFVFLSRLTDLTNSTNVYRTYVYQCYWQLGLAKPWWGWGINRTAALCEQRLKARYGGVNHAHNFVLQLFADNGAIATLVCVALIIYFIVLPSLKFMVDRSSSVNFPLYLGICFASLTIPLISLFQSSFYHYPLFPLWLGLLSGTISTTFDS